MIRPTATIVIPCFNHGKFVRAAVESCLRQQHADVRVVIVNDGSNDGETPAACDACASEHVTVIHQENRGLPAARNRGVAAAPRRSENEYLAFLDADDFIEPTFVRTLAAAIEDADSFGRLHKLPPVSHAYCQEQLIELGEGIWRVPDWDPRLMMLTNLHPVTALVKRSAFDASSGFDESMRDGYEDWDFWLSLAERGFRAVRVQEALFVWRRHSTNTMVIEAVKKHDSLFRHIVARHREYYAKHADELFILSNNLLRKFDVNWLDESGWPITLLCLWANRDELAKLKPEHAALVQRAGSLESQLAQARSHLETLTARSTALQNDVAFLNRTLDETRAWYEGTMAMRLHHAFKRVLSYMPRPLSAAADGTFKALKKLVPGSRRAAHPGHR